MGQFVLLYLCVKDLRTILQWLCGMACPTIEITWPICYARPLSPESNDRGRLNGYLNSALVLGVRGAWLGPEQHISGGQRDEFDHMLKSAVEVMDSQAYKQ